jgi:hypothetical protein
MDLKCTNKTNVFADWLSVTCSPEISFVTGIPDDDGIGGSDPLAFVLDSFGGSIHDFSRPGCLVYFVGKGTVKIQESKNFHSASFSGAALQAIRELGKLDYLLSSIAAVPHSITRLDAALDTSQDGADVFAHYQNLYSRADRYPKLTRKAVMPSYISSRRASDGRVTGTINIGGIKNTKVSARIYDKQAEVLSKQALHIPSTTRYELTVRRDMNPSLRDVSDPTSIFWHYMGNTVLKRPSTAPVWTSGWGGAWNMVVEKPLVYQVVKAKIENNPELLRIFELAAMMSGNGRLEALNMIKRKHVDIDTKKQKKSA